MALTVHCKLDDALVGGIAKIKEEFAPIRALLITVVDEVLVLHGEPIEANVDFAGDLKQVQTVIASSKLNAAFVLLKVDEKKFSLVIYVEQGVNPRQKMMYASTAHWLRDETGIRGIREQHISLLEELVVSLFEADSAEMRRDLMSEKEKMQEVIAALPAAPQPMCLPGVATPLTADAVEAVKKFAAKEVNAAVFEVLDGGIGCVTTLPDAATHSDFVAALPKDHPRFAMVHWDASTVVMVYVCPSVSKPRERMTYASTRASFLAQAMQHGVTFSRKVETDDPSELVAVVEEALRDVDPSTMEAPAEKPAAPKTIHGKGPRMLI